MNFTLASSLPPMVAGSVTGEVEVLVPLLYPKPGVLSSARYLRDGQRDVLFAVRVRWWGDAGQGTALKPGILDTPDKQGEHAERDMASRATCALFPVRCGADGLAAYLEDMGSITVDVLVHEGAVEGTRHVARCVVPVKGWGRSIDRQDVSLPNAVVAEGYFPVRSMHGNAYAGELRVRISACLGERSRLRRVLTQADDGEGSFGEVRGIVQALVGGDDVSSLSKTGVEMWTEEQMQDGPSPSPAGKHAVIPRVAIHRSPLDGDGLSNGSSEDSLTLSSSHLSRPPAAASSSFQLNEALATLDASDTLPIWPTPLGTLYRPPEARGEASPMQPQARSTVKGRAAETAGVKGTREPLPVSKGAPGLKAPVRIGVALSSRARTPGIVAGGAPGVSQPVRSPKLMPSLSQKRQAPEPNPATRERDTSKRERDVARGVGGSVGGGSESPRELSSPELPSRIAGVHPEAPFASITSDHHDLSDLLSRGKELRDKMSAIAVEKTPLAADSATHPPVPPHNSAGALGSVAGDYAEQPGLVSGAPLGSSLRDDIEDIFDTLSDDPASGVDENGPLARDARTRAHEDRVVDILLEAAGPPPATLAFPALAAVERRRADALARVRFLRIRVSRLVMFGSMASSPDGHGWQIRFRLPSFAATPAQGIFGRRAQGSSEKPTGRDSLNPKIISFPVPPRVSASAVSKGKTSWRGRAAAAGGTSVLRVRRNFGASDLAVGETNLSNEVVCAVDVDDVCVRQWMAAAMEFLLVDGKTQGAPAARRAQRRMEALSAVGPGDRVKAVAQLPLRDLLLSAELGLATTLDLTEVSDFWALEDARAAGGGARGRRGRPLRNPYRGDGTVAVRPLVLGDRAVGALAVMMELVPGETDAHPEHTRPPDAERALRERRVSSARQVGTEDGVAPSVPAGRHGDNRDSMDGRLDDGSSLLSPWLSDDDARWRAGQDGRTGSADVEAKTRGGASDDLSRGPGVSTLLSPSSNADHTTPQPNTEAKPTLSPQGTDHAVILRVKELSLCASAALGVEKVRVAYSFTEVGELNPVVIPRSVHGRPTAVSGDHAQRKQGLSSFAFEHEDVYPAPAEGADWRSLAESKRVFEVWGSSMESGALEGTATDALLGLAKVCLEPFAAFASRRTRAATESGLPGSGGSMSTGAGDRSRDGVSIAADGPVAVVDPFSGKTVGELRVFLALGVKSEIDGLRQQRLKAAFPDEGGTNDAVRASNRAQVSGTNDGKGFNDSDIDKETKGQGEKHGGDDDHGGRLSPQKRDLALNDSAEELSMLLNPSRAAVANLETERTPPVRTSGGFTGLVRHVIELSPVGEVPLVFASEERAITADTERGVPSGCAIEYSLPAPHPKVSADDEKIGYEMWWDADSGVLNSRVRHTLKLPGGLLDALQAGDAPTSNDEFNVTDSATHCAGEHKKRGALEPHIAGSEAASLNGLLDQLMGRDNVVLRLFWTVAGGPAEPQISEEAVRSQLGIAVLRRSDLLPLVRQSSAHTVLSIPITPDQADDSDSYPVPEFLPLSVTYRREPSAVARRKSRPSGAAQGRAGSPAVRGEKDLEVPGPRSTGDTWRGSGPEDPAVRPSGSRGEKEPEGTAVGSPGREPEAEDSKAQRTPSAWTEQGLHSAPSTTTAIKATSVAKIADTSEGRMVDLVMPAAVDRTEQLLPARTKVCASIGTVDLVSWPIEDEGLWTSFVFPGYGEHGAAERKRGIVYVWRPESSEEEDNEVHWSPAVFVRRDKRRLGGRASLDWQVELPVSINAHFVDLMHTRQLQVWVWRGPTARWPRGGVVCGVAPVELASLLVDPEGVGGDIDVFEPGDAGGRAVGTLSVRVFFKHRGLGPGGAVPSEARHVGGEGKMHGVQHVQDREQAGLQSDLVSEKYNRLNPAEGTARQPAAASVTAQAEIGGWQTPPGGPPTVTLAARSGGSLTVCVERAMRLPHETPGGDQTSSGHGKDPSTYVTFRWEEGGKVPLQPVLAFGGGLVGDKGPKTGEGEEEVTSVVEHSSNPVYNHETELQLTDAGTWSRVCGSEAALVFRVWRRAPVGWWVAAQSSPSDERGVAGGVGCRDFNRDRDGGGGCFTATPASRFGDRSIGSAVVRLHVLRGATRPNVRLGVMREINGWYHVLDDLQRSQGQIKVLVRPHPPRAACDLTRTSSKLPTLAPSAGGTGADDLLSNVSINMPRAGAAVDDDKPGNVDTAANASAELPMAPLPALFHDDRARVGGATNARTHALSDDSGAHGHGSISALPVPGLPHRGSPEAVLGEAPAAPDRNASVEPVLFPRVNMRIDVGLGEPDERAPSSLSELQRMLLSLDKVDRRLVALGSNGGGAAASAGGKVESEDSVRQRRDDGSDGSRSAASGDGSLSNSLAGDVEQEGAVRMAASRIQRSWRERRRRLTQARALEAAREAAAEAAAKEEAELSAQREAYLARQERREEAARKIQKANRRAQARYREKAAVEEKRRREAQRRRRAWACRTIERAWKAFELRRTAARNVAEARARAAAQVEAQRRFGVVEAAATRLQSWWRGSLGRTRVRQIRARPSKVRAREALNTTGKVKRTPGEMTTALTSTDADFSWRSLRPAPRTMPSTFYNQLSQDPRRRFPLPDTHVAAVGASANLSLAASFETDQARLGTPVAGSRRPVSCRAPRPALSRSAGPGQPPRFADLETARIARIMKGNLQSLAGSRGTRIGGASSSSDDFEL